MTTESIQMKWKLVSKFDEVILVNYCKEITPNYWKINKNQPVDVMNCLSLQFLAQ